MQDTSSYKLRILYYDGNYSLNETKTINGELPFFGTFCTDGSYYYVISGQDNPAEDDNVECYRVTKYDKSWKKSKSCAITNCYTARPFYIGGCAAAFSGNVLMVHTGHESYTYSDGLKHQTNLTFTVNTAEMQRMASITRFPIRKKAMSRILSTSLSRPTGTIWSPLTMAMPIPELPICTAMKDQSQTARSQVPNMVKAST